jgi:hypothetical protein
MLQHEADLQALRPIGVQSGEKERSLSFVPGSGENARGEMAR